MVLFAAIVVGPRLRKLSHFSAIDWTNAVQLFVLEGLVVIRWLPGGAVRETLSLKSPKSIVEVGFDAAFVSLCVVLSRKQAQDVWTADPLCVR